MIRSTHHLEVTPCLYTYEDFLIWYLSRFDLSIFGLEAVQGLIEEVKPTEYPCVPVVMENELDIYMYLPQAEAVNWVSSLKNL